jgi:molybdopterin-binding protein
MMRNILRGHLVSANDESGVFVSGELKLAVTTSLGQASFACIRPDDITPTIEPSPNPTPNSFAGVISRIEDRGMTSYIYVNVPAEICCLIGRNRLQELGLKTGQLVNIVFKPESVHVF